MCRGRWAARIARAGVASLASPAFCGSVATCDYVHSFSYDVISNHIFSFAWSNVSWHDFPVTSGARIIIWSSPSLRRMSRSLCRSTLYIHHLRKVQNSAVFFYISRCRKSVSGPCVWCGILCPSSCMNFRSNFAVDIGSSRGRVHGNYHSKVPGSRRR